MRRDGLRWVYLISWGLLVCLLMAGCEPAMKAHIRNNYPFEITVIRQSVPGYLKDEDTWLGTVPPKSEKTFDQTIDPIAPAHRLVIKDPDGKVVEVITESGDTLQSHITRDRPMIWTVTAGKPDRPQPDGGPPPPNEPVNPRLKMTGSDMRALHVAYETLQSASWTTAYKRDASHYDVLLGEDRTHYLVRLIPRRATREDMESVGGETSQGIGMLIRVDNKTFKVRRPVELEM